MVKQSTQHGFISGRAMAEAIAKQRSAVAMDTKDVAQYAALKAVGIGFDAKFLSQGAVAYGMDSLQNPITAGSTGTPVQFLQSWLPGFVHVATAPRQIDVLTGIATVGEWHDEEVVQGILEMTGKAVPYGDTTPVPLVGYNATYERRTIQRFEAGFAVGSLESARGAAARLDAANQKRASAMLALNIIRNDVGFFGYNDGNSRTYGFLNDPSLPAYKTVAQGAAGDTKWARKTYEEIINDLTVAFTQLVSQSKGIINAVNTPTTLALPAGHETLLNTANAFGMTVKKWLLDNYPNCRIETAPQLSSVNGGVDAFYLYADEVSGDSSDDDRRVWVQMVPAQFMALGVDPQGKRTVEDNTNATAGVMCKRPYAIYRASGI